MEGDVIDSKNHFLISINGQIFSGCFPYLNDLYCKYSFVCGSDWIVISVSKSNDHEKKGKKNLLIIIHFAS